jgi:hypothetical protein
MTSRAREAAIGLSARAMPQIFHRSTNTLSRLSIFGALFSVAGLLYGLAPIKFIFVFTLGDYLTRPVLLR